MFHIYVYQNEIQDGLDEVFLNLNHSVSIQLVNAKLMKINIETSITEEDIDFHMLHASIVADFDIDTTLIYLDDVVFKYITEQDVFVTISALQHQVYDVNRLLVYLSQDNETKQNIKRKMIHLLGQDYINTIQALAKSNMNLSITAKQLFLHRNSLNYRIEKLYEKTSIDIKTFVGLRALISIIEA